MLDSFSQLAVVAASLAAVGLVASRLRSLERAVASAIRADRARDGSEGSTAPVGPLDPPRGADEASRARGSLVDRSATPAAIFQERFRTSFDSAAVGMALVGRDGRWLQVNRSFCDILGYEESELLSTTFHELTHPDDLYSGLSDLQRLLMGELGSLRQEKRYFRKDGEVVWIRLNISHVRDVDGDPLYLIVQGEDITETQRAQVRLREAKEEAEAASEAKSRFLANMSHEIRTPIHGIMGMAELALASELDPDPRRYVGAVRRAAGNLLSLVNDLLDFSKVEAGKLELDPVPFALRSFLDGVVDEFRIPAEQKGLWLRHATEEQVPDVLRGDPVRIRQVLVNLLGNALRFTESGGIDVAVACVSREGSQIELRLSVRDTGVGIPVDKQAAIFRSFCQADGSVARKYGGTGLGLAISAQLSALLGGRIWVESRPGEGSTFHFTCRLEESAETLPSPLLEPRAEDGASPFPDGAPVAERSLRVLLAEDNDLSREVAVAFLSRWGHRVVAVENGLRAVESLREGDFDLVLMDMQMPEMDGVEATRQIRSEEVDRERHVPILAMTANVLEEDRAECLRAGMDGCLCKPVHPDDLQRAIEEATRDRPVADGLRTASDQADDPEGGAASPADAPVDLAIVRDTLGNFDILLPRLVEVFLREYPRQLGELRTALGAGEAETVRRCAHSLKSSCAQLGATVARSVARRIEDTARSGDLSGVEAECEELAGALADARSFYESDAWRPESARVASGVETTE